MYFRRLEELRSDNDKTQEQISKKINCALATYRRYEKGYSEIPASAVIALAKYYRVSTDYLLGLK